ncbi:MAG: hypothetical protein U9Q03_00655 [Patescibacteria group bacterium]|nr:hypothetical protein [Patescibacteria group bacterium]
MHKPRKTTKKALASITLAAMFMLYALPVNAAIFNPNYIISDAEMRDMYAMEFMDIYYFLGEKGGLNNHFDVDPEDSLLKGTAQLIDDAAKRYRINPKYVMSLMQKESGVIETQTPTEKQLDWAVGYGLCDGCYKSSELAQKYKGFAKQIDAGAGWMDWFMTNSSTLTYLEQPGTTFTVSGVSVTPANLATAGLYNYTPHLHGNRLLWKIMQRWWGEGEDGMRFPDGTVVVNTETGAAAVIQNGKFRPILNRSVLETRFSSVAPVELGPYEFGLVEKANPGAPIKFTDLALVRADGDMAYLLVGDERRPIPTDEVFRAIGFNPEEIEDVTLADIEDYALGVAITLDERYPLGQLIQNSETGGVYFVRSGNKYPIWDRVVLDINFGGMAIVPMTPEELDEIPTGDPVTFNDGLLVKAPEDATVYVISAAKKRSIPSEEVFLGYGYKWTSIVTVPQKVLDLIPNGEQLLLFEEEVVATGIE